jgi:hypothetical protein
MAQQRRETRHSIDKKGTIQIKPSFEPDEEDDYVHDAELVLRAVICLQLELPLATATREGGVSVEELVEP